MDSQIGFQLLLLLFLILVNAFFAGAEMAVVSVNKNKIKMLAEDGNKKAQLILALMNDSTRFLSTIQVAITFAGFFSSASAATGISQVLGENLAHYNIPYSSTIAIVAVTLLLSFFTLVFGELVPKHIALQKAEDFSLFCVRPIYYISLVVSPFIKLLSMSCNGFLHLIHMRVDNLEEAVSKEEIRALIESGSEAGVFNEIEKDMINSIFTFDDKVAVDVMIPRNDVLMLDGEESLDDNIEVILKSRYSRIPVYEGSVDNIIGIFKVKDFLIDRYYIGDYSTKVHDYLSEAFFVPERKNIDELFREMQKQRERMAILIDEYGGFAGIVTLEDLVEEIMGDMYEEHEEEEPDMIELEKNQYLLDGSMSIDDFNEALHFDLESDNYDTISGLILENIGNIPSEGEQIEVTIENLLFQIQKVEGRRITKVLLTVLPRQ